MGEISAARLFDSGIYHQLDYAERAKRVENRRSLARHWTGEWVTPDRLCFRLPLPERLRGND